MPDKKEKEIDEFVKQLLGNDEEEVDPKYPLPQDEPIRYTDVDVVILPKGYKGYPTPDSKQRFTDSMETMKIDLDNVEENDGILTVPVTVANSKHVYNYDGFKVRKPLEELKAMSLFADNRPITREHPTAGIVTDRREIMGFFKSPSVESDVLKGILEITDKDLIADVKAEKFTDVSPGFFCDINRDDTGDVDGVHYDAVQEHILLDHVAIVEEGRCSIKDGCGIGLDAKTPVPQSVMDKLKSAVESAKTMKEKELEKLLKDILRDITVARDGSEKKNPEIDAGDLFKIKDAFAIVTTERDSLREELDKIVKAEKDSLIDSLTSVQKTKTESDLKDLSIDALKKELAMVKDLQVKRLSGQDSGEKRSSRKQIDAAYSKIGV